MKAIKVIGVNTVILLCVLVLLELLFRVVLYGKSDYYARFAEQVWVQQTPQELIAMSEQRSRLSVADLSRFGTVHRWNELYELSDYQVFGDLEPNRDYINLIVPEHPYRVVTNAAGFRRKSQMLEPKPESTYRVLALGDSFTFGPYVANYETWPAITEAILDDGETVGTDYEVLNAGIAGYFLRREKNLYLNRARYAQPDLVILQILDNDLIGYQQDSYPRPDVTPQQLQLSSGDLVFRLKRLIQKYGESIALLDFVSRLVNQFYPEPDYEDFAAESTQAELFLKPQEVRVGAISALDESPDISELPFQSEYASDFAELAAAVEKDGARLMVMYLPTQSTLRASRARGDKFERYFKELADQYGITFLSLSSAFLAQDDERHYYLWPWNGHLNASGNHLIATVLAEFLKDTD